MIKKLLTLNELLCMIQHGTQPDTIYVKNENGTDKEAHWVYIAKEYMTKDGYSLLFKLNKETIFLSRSFYYYINPLDEIERAYLRNLIAPFRSKVKYVCKCGTKNRNKYTIDIFYREKDHTYDGCITLPPFERSSEMYKGMEIGRTYTIEELGL